MAVLIQILINSIISGILLSLVAIGFTYIFLVTRVFHLAHGGIYITGAIASWWIVSMTNNLFVAIGFAIIVVSILIYSIEKAVYLPLNKKQSNQSISLIASMGLFVIIINVLALIFGNQVKIFENAPTGSFEFGQIILTKMQLIQTIVSLLTIVAFYFYLKFTKSSLVWQSVSDNETISKVLGVNTERERVKVLVIGSILACIAAVLKSSEVGIDLQDGMGITLTASVIAILVTRSSLFLIILFSIALSVLQNTVEWFLNAQWKNGITFLVLLLVILFRTEGIISYNLRKDRV